MYNVKQYHIQTFKPWKRPHIPGDIQPRSCVGSQPHSRQTPVYAQRACSVFHTYTHRENQRFFIRAWSPAFFNTLQWICSGHDNTVCARRGWSVFHTHIQITQEGEKRRFTQTVILNTSLCIYMSTCVSMMYMCLHILIYQNIQTHLHNVDIIGRGAEPQRVGPFRRSPDAIHHLRRRWRHVARRVRMQRRIRIRIRTPGGVWIWNPSRVWGRAVAAGDRSWGCTWNWPV